MERKEIGLKHFGPRIDITDPCYHRDVWCRLNDIEIKEGDYRCVVYTVPYSYDFHGETVSFPVVNKIGIYLGDDSECQCGCFLGEIGVDAGLAGFFNNKPDYNYEEWQAFCDAIDGKQYLINGEGFFSSSGHGDGSYPVFCHKDENEEIDAVEILFLN